MMVSLNKWLDDTGYPKSTFRGWKPKLVRGVHYVVVGRVTSVDPEEMDKWLRASDTVEVAGSSEPQLPAKATKPSLPAPTLRLV